MLTSNDSPNIAGPIADCYTCKMAGAWNFPNCPTCPSYQKNHFATSLGGSPQTSNYICVGESPYLMPLAESGNHSGWIKDIERSVRLTFETLEKNYDNPVGHFTYAVRCQAEKPSAKEINACAPNLIAEILEYSVPEKPICIFVMGATGLKALGIPFKKYMEVIGKTIETTIEGRRAYVFVSLSKRQLVTKAGYSEILKRQVEVFLEMVRKNAAGTLEEQRTILARLSEGYRYPTTALELDTLITDILRETTDATPIAIDTETNTLYPHRSKLKLLMVSVSWGTGRSAAIQLEHPESVLKLEHARPHLERLFLSSRYKIFANAKYDLKVLERKGFKVRRLSWDVMLGEHLIEEDKKGFYGLKSITRLRLPEFAAYEDELKEIYAKRMDNDSLVPAPIEDEAEEKLLLKQVKPKRKKKDKAEGPKLSRLEKKLAEDDGFQAIPLRDLLQYAAFDTDVTLRIAAQQRKELTEESRKLTRKRLEFVRNPAPNSQKIGETLCPIPNPPQYNMSARIIPTTRVLAKMELHGMAVDRPYILQLQADMDSYLASSSAIFSDMLPVGFADFNPASTQHVAKALFSTGYLQPGTGALVCYAGKIEPPRTEKGAISTDAKFLKFLATTHKCALSTALLEFRGISKARSTFIENIEVLSREDGRMHSNFHQHGTATNRLCVSKNTWLKTTIGKVRICNLNLSAHPNVYIRTHKNRLRRILGVYYKGKEAMYRVTKDDGSFIETTQEHRFNTPGGFRHLRELNQKDEIITDRHSTTPHPDRFSYGRRVLRRPLSTAKTHVQRVQTTRNILQNTEQFSSILQIQIPRRNKGAKTFPLFSCSKRKFAREERFPRCINTVGNPDSLFRTRLQLENDRQRIRCECLVRTPKYAALQGKSHGKTPISINEFRHGYPTNARPICSGHSQSCNPLLRGPSTLFSTPLRSTSSSNRTNLVYQRTIPSIRRISSPQKIAKKSHLLELESIRNAPIQSSARQQHTARTSSFVIPELFGGLWVSREEATRGDRRRLSQADGDPKTGCTEEAIHRRTRVHDSQFLHSRNRKKSIKRRRGNTFSIGHITNIEPIGVMDVWDIQVEEDHSYVAHGFVNHNSSSEENMQNIPKKIGKPPHQYNIKRVFIPTSPEFILVNADAKAAEVRVYAAYSHDKALIAALNDGMDPHSFFASTVYNVDNVLKDVAPGQRQGVLETIGLDMEHAWSYADFEARDSIKKTDKAYGEQLDSLRKNIKRVVFGILYGAAPKKIAGIVGIPDDQAQAIIKSLFDMFPSIKGYIRATKDQVNHLGIVETFLGRRRHLNLKNLPNIMRGRAERQAVNFKIQNTSAEMVLDVLCATDPVISNDFGGNMLNTVHDSLVFQIPKKYVHQMPAFIQDYGVKQVAQKFPWLPVPFSWDVEVGKTYGDLMPVSAFLSDHPELAKSDNDDDDYLDLEIRNALAEEGAAEQSAA